MIDQIHLAKHSGNGFRCLYNEDRLTKQEIDNLLQDEGKQLFEQKELICETEVALSYTIDIADTPYFAKQYKHQGFCKQLAQTFNPPAQASFCAGIRVMHANLPTPIPVLACSVRRKGRQHHVLITDYCEDAQTVADRAKSAKRHARMIIVEELAFLLADFHSKGFRSPHLQSDNILISEHQGERAYWFIDLDRLSESKFLSPGNYIDTIARVCGELFSQLEGEERKHLLRVCFNAALKQNVYKKPSDEKKFRQAAVARMKHYYSPE